MSNPWSMGMGAWSDSFADFMLPFDRLKLSRADLVFIGHGTPGFSFLINDPCPDGFSQALKSDLTQVMARYPMGAHLRLDMCSFRTNASTPRVAGTNGAMWLMRQANPRVSGVVRRGLSEGQQLSLFVFPWLPIPHWAEFRVFFRDGRLAGISQMYSDQVFTQIGQHEAAITKAMDVFVANMLPRLQSADLAMDVLVEPVPQEGFRIRLIDMTILGPRTDTALFNWNIAGDFDGSFRFRKAEVTQTLGLPGLIKETEQTLAPVSLQMPPPSTDEDTWRL